MNSVALPASASAPALSAEDELVRHASRGQAEALAELFRRHGQMAWRLAQAVAIDRDGAVSAVGHGFARALRGSRRHRPEADTGFRPALLSAIYRTAIEDARARTSSVSIPAAQATPIAAKGKAKSDDSALVAAAFRSLPERWRGALWLTEVESLTPDRVAPILGVSEAVATQLITRGHRGFSGRFAQAHRPLPQHVGTALRPLALAIPADLGDIVAASCKAAASDPTERFAPISAWLADRAVRPLQAASASLLALGVIGTALVGQSALVAVGGPPTTASPSGQYPAVPNPGGPPRLVQPGNPLFPITSAPALTASTGIAGQTGSNTTPGNSTGPGTASILPNHATPPPPAKTTPGKPVTGTQPPSVNLSPLATVTSSGGSSTINLLAPSSTAPGAVAVTLCSTGIGLKVGTIQLGCTPVNSPAPAASSSSTSGTSAGVVGGVLSDVGTLVKGL